MLVKNNIIEPSPSMHLVICIFSMGQYPRYYTGANLYYVTDFVCIICTIVNWVYKTFSNDRLESIQ